MEGWGIVQNESENNKAGLDWAVWSCNETCKTNRLHGRNESKVRAVEMAESAQALEISVWRGVQKDMCPGAIIIICGPLEDLKSDLLSFEYADSFQL